MKVLKPSKLSIVTRSFEVQRRYQLGISILAFFDLESGALYDESALWLFAAKELGKDTAIDVGIPKERAEFLVTGSAFVPEGLPSETCPVTVTLGRLQKTLYVVGDRLWKGAQQTKPIPFTSMPLTWDRAFGGPGFARNPLGKGFEAQQTEFGPVQVLPNVELPGQMITSPKQRPEPAGFGPIDITWPQRFSKVGTYDQKWLKELFPGFARDVDWSIHNIASPDQQQPTPFVGDEAITVVNMHASRSRLEGALPGIKTRAFVTQRRGAAEEFLEVPMRLTTVWLFPHAVRGILVFQGSMSTSEDDAADVIHLLVGAELLSQDKGVAHYREVLEKRLDKDRGALYSLRDEDLQPPLRGDSTAGTVAEDLELVKVEGLLGKNLRKKAEAEIEKARALVASYGLDPNEQAPPVMPPEEPLPDDPVAVAELIARVQADAEKKQQEQQKELEDAFREITPILVQAGVDPEAIRQEMTTAKVGPPTYTAEGEIRRIGELAAESRARGLVIDELESWLTDEELHAGWRQIEQQIKDAYLALAHEQSPAPRMRPDAAARARREFEAALRDRRSFAYYNLTGADLSGLDLRGADLRRAWLESADLSRANLEGADLGEAVLAHAVLTGARLANTSLRGANLGGAILSGVEIGNDVDLSGAVLAKATLAGATLDGVKLDGALFSEMSFATTTMRRITASDVTFYKVDLCELSLAGADLVDVSFIDSDVAGVDFSDALLKSVTFVNCTGTGAKFLRAKGRNIVVVLCGSFAKADFRGAELASVNLRGIDLSRSDFSGATFNGCDLSEASLKDAKLYRCVAKDARFVRTDLRQADLTAANLMGADLQKADIRGAKFVGANLFGANFARVHADEATDLRESNQKRVTTYPLRRP